MIVEPDRLRAELAGTCADAGLDPSAFAVWIVDAARPAGTTPIAYLQPAGVVRTDTVTVFRVVGAARAARFAHIAHRLALWRDLPGLPDAALGPVVRHELEHARRWQKSGTAFYEADERLRARVGAAAYAGLPTEREANAAAAAYACGALSAGELAELEACAELADLFAAEPVDDVVAATLALLGEDVPFGAERPLDGLAGGPVIELV